MSKIVSNVQNEATKGHGKRANITVKRVGILKTVTYLCLCLYLLIVDNKTQNFENDVLYIGLSKVVVLVLCLNDERLVFICFLMADKRHGIPPARSSAV